MKKLTFLSFLILNFSFLIVFPSCTRKEAPPPVEPEPLPPIHNFALINLLSEFPAEITTSNYFGNVQLIVFFRPDNPACRGSIPDWNALQADFAPRGFTLVGAITDHRKPNEISADTLTLGATFPLGLAETPVLNAFGGPTALRAIPTSFLLSRDGTLLRTYSGFEPLPRLREDIDHALDGKDLIDRNPKTVAPEDNTP